MIERRNLVRALRKALGEPSYAWHAFRLRFLSDLSYRFRDGFSTYPETISLFLTYKCNLRCKMCGQWGEKGSSWGYSKEKLSECLSVSEIKSLIDDVRSFKPNITLFGGEPLLYRGWDDVVQYVKAAGMRCNMVTNGVLLRTYGERVVEVGLDETIFSLDGPGEVHDAIRGIRGLFGRAAAGFAKMAQAKKKAGVDRPALNISSCMFEENYERMLDTVAAAESIGANSITFHHLIFLSEERYRRHNEIFVERFGTTSPDWGGFVRQQLPKIDPEKLIELIRAVKEWDGPIDVSVYPNFTDDEIRRYYTDFDFLPQSYKCRCMSPWMVSYIFPDGSVRPCQSLNLVVGNVREKRFTEVWNDAPWASFRRELKRRRMFPVCNRCTEFYRF